jgi:formylglycine-generating enzyme required for sulfatase activity
MKTWKHGIIGIIAIIALTACDDGNKPNENKEFTPTVIEEVYVQGGTFEMGKDLGIAAIGDYTPVQTVTLTSFYMGKYEVTQGQYQAVMGTLPSWFDDENYVHGKGNNYPMYYVSWYDTIEFCNKLSVLEGLTPYYTINKKQADPNNTNNEDTIKWLVTPNTSANGYRLPTEAQWEYAAKGGNTGETFTYAGSDTASDVAWFNTGINVKEAGTKAPNGLGLYDMSGNVWEWCWDWYEDYSSGTQTNPMGASSGFSRVWRGGSEGNVPNFVRLVFRYSTGYPQWGYTYVGFRIVRP